MLRQDSEGQCLRECRIGCRQREFNSVIVELLDLDILPTSEHYRAYCRIFHKSNCVDDICCSEFLAVMPAYIAAHGNRVGFVRVVGHCLGDITLQVTGRVHRVE